MYIVPEVRWQFQELQSTPHVDDGCEVQTEVQGFLLRLFGLVI